MFVLATTDPRDIPATVLSRVQRFDFRPIAPDVLASALERILVEEKIPFDAAALPAVVRAAEGSLRDALSLLDTAIAYGDGRLDAGYHRRSSSGTTAPAEVRGPSRRPCVAHDTGPALEAIDRAAREGEDLHAFIRDVIELLRRALVLKAAPTTKLADLTHDRGQRAAQARRAAALDEMLYILRALARRRRDHARVAASARRAGDRDRARHAPPGAAGARRGAASRGRGGGQRLRQASAYGASAPARVQESSARPRAAHAAPRAPTSRRSRSRAAPTSAGPGAASAAAAESQPPAPAAPPVELAARDGNLEAGWQRASTEDRDAQAHRCWVPCSPVPGPAASGTASVTLVLTGNHFHRELLADTANREVVAQAVRRRSPGPSGSRVIAKRREHRRWARASHPAVQAAMAEFQGEVVAVRARSPEGEGQ